MYNTIYNFSGATAQGAVNGQNKDLEPNGWTTDSLGRRVETALGSFNTTIPEQAIKRYNEYFIIYRCH